MAEGISVGEILMVEKDVPMLVLPDGPYNALLGFHDVGILPDSHLLLPLRED